MNGASWRIVSAVLLCVIAMSFAACSGSTDSATPAAQEQPAPAAASIPPEYEGSHDNSGCGEISGWVWDKNHPNVAVSVDVFDGDAKVGTVVAERLRPDLLNAGVGSGKYGFMFPVPASLKDGRSHSISAKVAGAGLVLRDTPRTLICGAADRMYEGAHDTATCDQITGWARDRNHPDEAVKVEISDERTKLATLNADQLRGDLLAAGVGSGLYGFMWTVPASLKDGRPHAIRVTIAATRTALQNTPKSLTCRTP